MNAAKPRTAAQGSNVKGGIQEMAHGEILFEAKAEADIFPGSDFELFCKSDYRSLSESTPALLR